MFVVADEKGEKTLGAPRTAGDALRAVRESQKRRTGVKVTQRDAARLVGLNEEVYRSIEYERRELRPEEARILAEAWRCTVPDLYAIHEAKAPRRQREATEPVEPMHTMPKIEVPFVGPGRAGPWNSPLETDEEESIDVDMYAPNVFTSYLLGDSMEGFLFEGDQLVFKATDPQGGPTERALPRDVVMARNSENELTVKQYMMDGILPYLHPLNDAYEDIYDVGGEWKVIGILTGFIRDDDGDKVKRHNSRRLRPK